MSTTARWMVGFMCVVIAIMTGSIPVMAHRSLQGDLCCWGIVLFCLAFAATCFIRPLYGMMIRLLGATFFLGYVGFVYLQCSSTQSGMYAPSTNLSTYGAARGLLLGLVIFCIPGMYMAWTGKVPQWMLGKNWKRPD